MESSIQQNIYYQNLKYEMRGPYPIYDLYPIERIQSTPKNQKVKTNKTKKKIKLSDKIMSLDLKSFIV